MTHDAKAADVAIVLAQLREEVRRQRQALHLDDNEAAMRSQLRRQLNEVQTVVTVNPHLPIAWPTWPPGLLPKLVALVQKVTRRLLRWYINPIVEQQNAYNRAVSQALAALVSEVERMAAIQAELSIDERLERLDAEWTGRWERAMAELRAATQAELATTRAELQVWVDQVQGWDARFRHEAEIIAERLRRLERKTVTASPAAVAPPTEAPTNSSLDYFGFELRFRGSPAEIQARQQVYLPYFRGRKNVLDIGCGRGEFVALLHAEGVGVHGLDLDADAVAYARERGLPVIQAEALAYLDALPNDSLDGIYMAQVVEHLEPAVLLRLLTLCAAKLQHGAPLVAETINPACLLALSTHYLIDPTHVRPVHPETLRFLLESAGFWQVDLKFLTPVPDNQRLQPIRLNHTPSPAEREQVEQLNRIIERLNEILFGYQDYAAIGWKPPARLDGDVW